VIDREDGLERARRPAIPEIVSASARRVPDRVALVFEGQSVTFAELDARSGAVAAALRERGVGEGDNVAMLMYNRLEFVEAFLGIQRLGACAVPVNFRLAADEVAYVLEDSRAVGLLVEEALAEQAPPTGGFRLALGERGGGEFEAALAAAGEPPDRTIDDEHLAFLMYTSGTTGRPKGAMLSHRNLTANTMNWLYEVGAGAEDVWLSGLPLFHIGGLNGVLPFLALGATAAIEPSTGFDAARSLARLDDNAVTMCFFVPTQWQEICALAAASDADLSRLRVAMWGASPAPLALLEELREALPSVRIVNAFGQTEMSSNTAFLKGEDAVRKMGSIGRPAINVEVRIVDDDGNDVARGEVGEIVYRGPTVMRGYFGKPEETAAAFAGGWFHSGDLVREDEDGYMYVVDRLKDMLISGGENVYPAEVERTLIEHPGVAEVAVVGVPHPRWVETPLAVVVAVPGATVSEEELIELCRARLAGYKKPGAVVFAAELPRNAAGKVMKRRLRERHGEMFVAT
jgi:acyl-CoA synthetase (AMP-forming)/AMP-acid ligase II